MLRLRRKSMTLVWLAVMALLGSMIGGAIVRMPAAAAGSVVDSVLGTLVICHQVAGDTATDTRDGSSPAPSSPRSDQHDCNACFAGAACAPALAPSNLADDVSPPRTAARSVVSTHAPALVDATRPGSIGSRAPPSFL